MAIITNRRRSNLVALSLVAPFLVAFGLFFLNPSDPGGADELHPTARRSSAAASGWALPTARSPLRQALLHLHRQQRLLCPPDGDPDHRHRTRHRADGQPPQGPAPGLRPRHFLPALRAAGLGRHQRSRLWMLDFQYGILQPVFVFFTGKPVAGLPQPLLGDADHRRPDLSGGRNGFNVLLFISIAWPALLPVGTHR